MRRPLAGGVGRRAPRGQPLGPGIEWWGLGAEFVAAFDGWGRARASAAVRGCWVARQRPQAAPRRSRCQAGTGMGQDKRRVVGAGFLCKHGHAVPRSSVHTVYGGEGVVLHTTSWLRCAGLGGGYAGWWVGRSREGALCLAGLAPAVRLLLRIAGGSWPRWPVVLRSLTSHSARLASHEKPQPSQCTGRAVLAAPAAWASEAPPPRCTGVQTAAACGMRQAAGGGRLRLRQRLQAAAGSGNHTV